MPGVRRAGRSRVESRVDVAQVGLAVDVVAEAALPPRRDVQGVLAARRERRRVGGDEGVVRARRGEVALERGRGEARSGCIREGRLEGLSARVEEAVPVEILALGRAAEVRRGTRNRVPVELECLVVDRLRAAHDEQRRDRDEENGHEEEAATPRAPPGPEDFLCHYKSLPRRLCATSRAPAPLTPTKPAAACKRCRVKRSLICPILPFPRDCRRPGPHRSGRGPYPP